MKGRSIGMDIHRDFCGVAICEQDRVRCAGRIAARRGALREFAEQLGPEDRVAMEAASNALEVARLLRPHVKDVVVANTRRLAAIANAKNKTDHRDARTLAQLLHAGLLEDSWQPDKAIRALGRRTSRRASPVKHRAPPHASRASKPKARADAKRCAASNATSPDASSSSCSHQHQCRRQRPRSENARQSSPSPAR